MTVHTNSLAMLCRHRCKDESDFRSHFETSEDVASCSVQGVPDGFGAQCNLLELVAHARTILGGCVCLLL